MTDHIIIVSGLPRSGTSLMMQILDAGGVPIVHDQARPADQANPRGYFEDNRVNRLDKENSWLKNYAGKAVKITSHWLPYLPEGMPARIIFMQRNLHEVIASQNKMLESADRTDPQGLVNIYTSHIEHTMSWIARQPHLEVLVCHYVELISEPEKILREVDEFLQGRLRIEEARGAIRPELYRNKKREPL